jgi:tetratricopeptide (TPR) repeat protein
MNNLKTSTPLIVSQRLHECFPRDVQWVISLAYATRRAEGLNAARDILITALPKFPRAAIIYYNLACYDCQLGKIDSAKQYLKQAFQINSTWRLRAFEDEDLEPLWASL